MTTAEELRQAKAELGQPAMAHVPTLGAVSVTGPGRSKEQEAEPAQEKAAPGPVLADNPAHPDHSTYQQIHSWVRGTGNWNVEESKNVTASLYKQQTEDPLLQRVDKVTAGWAKTGRRTSLRSMRPLGTKDPFSMPMSTGARPRRSRPSRTCSRRRSLSRTRRDSRRWKRHSSRLHGKTRRDQAGRCKRFCLRWPQYSIAVSALLAK